MSRDDMAGIFCPEPSFDPRLEQVAALGDRREYQSQADNCRKVGNSSISDYRRASEYRAEGASEGAGPGLFRAKPRRQLRTADPTPNEIAENVGRPHDREQVQNGP